MLHALLLVALSAAACAGPSQSAIESAYSRDNFTVVQWQSYGSGQGCLAHSRIATTLDTGLPKTSFYLSGTAYEMGYIVALLAYPQVQSMAITYLNRFIPALAVPDLARELENDTAWQEFEQEIGDVLVEVINVSFHEQKAAGVYPQTILDEIQGVADGMRAQNASTPVTFERLAALNVGFDFVSAFGYTFNFTDLLIAQFARRGQPRVAAALEKAKHKLLTPLFYQPAACNAFAASGAATIDSKSIFARDFQLPTCDVFQDVQSLFIYSPTDGRHTIAASSAPGLTGVIAVMNEKGLAMGVDTMRSAAVNIPKIGLNSITLLRHVAGNANTTAAALNLIKVTPRGCPWLYPISDATGDGVIVESLSTFDGPAEDFNPLDYMQKLEEKLRQTLPDYAFIRAHSSRDIWVNGGYARRANWSYPQDYLPYNRALFQLVGYPYNASAFDPDGSIFANYTDEFAAQAKLEDKYFAPPRFSPDVVVVSNTALVPEARITMMNLECDLLQGMSGGGTQWRFDRLSHLVAQAHGSIDVDKAKDLILFLSPDRTPGFWKDYLDPSNPMTAQIEGSITVADLTEKKLWIKSGYYTDKWIGVSLLEYL